jgi:release factor glutamine methyltransferase
VLAHELYTKLKQIDSDSENCSVLKILFSYVLGKDYALTTWDELSSEDEEKITSLYQEYIDGKPVQYITHESYFLEKKFYVDERVLIPRFATEDVVLKAVEEVDASITSIADICTGSGAIALTLKNMFPHIDVIATDISKDALDVCEINKNNLGIDIKLYQGDLLEPLIINDIHVDMLISNPPYIEEDYELDRRVRDYEPKLALYSGKEGTNHYKKMLKDAKKVLNPRGKIVFEIGFNQRERLSKLICDTFGNEVEVEFYKDLDGNDRICIIKFV